MVSNDVYIYTVLPQTTQPPRREQGESDRRFVWDKKLTRVDYA